MYKIIGILLLVATSVMADNSRESIYYGKGLCAYSEYKCLTLDRGESWERLFPNPEQRDLVQRINRTSNYLWAGKVIAVPRDFSHLTILDIAPFAHKIETNEKQIIVDQDKLAWGAYDAQGLLVHWGP